MVDKSSGTGSLSSLEGYERLALAIFTRALRDVWGADAKDRADAILFLESSGAACLAGDLGFDIGRYRRGVEVLVTGQRLDRTA